MSVRMMKPLARVMQSPAMRRRSHGVVSRELEEALFRHADVLSEGYCRTLAGAGETYFGSTMIACDLGRVQRHVRGLDDALQRAELQHAIEGSVRLRLRAMRLACAEVARRVGQRALGTAMTEVRFRLTEGYLHIDVDLEVPLSVSSGSVQP